MEIFNHDLSFEIDLIIIFSATAILFLLPVLTHHDKRCLNRSYTGQHEIKQDRFRLLYFTVRL